MKEASYNIGEFFDADVDENPVLPQIKFGYNKLFSHLPPYFSDDIEDLKNLSAYMTSNLNRLTDSLIPAGYTYLGQFIDHDISNSSLNASSPGVPVDISSITNKRTPFLDLDSLYGDDSPESRHTFYSSNTLLKLGEMVVDGNGTGDISRTFPNDLPRNPENLKAIVADERNDENLAIAQIHVAFIKFHNTVIRKLGDDNSLELLEEAREEVKRHYQWIVLNDYLRKIIDPEVLDEVRFEGNKYYFPDSEKTDIPVEFSVAAFRLGHSMVRFNYQWNRVFSKHGSIPSQANLLSMMMFTGRGGMGGQKGLISAWATDWTRFFDFDGEEKTSDVFNFARSIDTKMTQLLGILPKGGEGTFSLAEHNLLRGLDVGLPSGQSVARQIKQDFQEIHVLKPEDLALVLPENLQDKFGRKTPLWYYLLAEAEIQQQGERLGQVGSRIVAEAFVGLLKATENSILNIPEWRPQFGPDSETFNMTDLLRFVAEYTDRDFDELNPLGNS